jgi:hypothetical protein
MLRRKLKFIWVLISLIVISIVLLYIYSRVATLQPFLSTTSPAGVYTVILKGQKERPRFFKSKVTFDAMKNGEPIASDQELHSGDSFDVSFESGYPNYDWIGENALHFYRKDDFNIETANNLKIANKTNTEIKYLKVYLSQDKFLLFNIPSSSETELRASASKGDQIGIFTAGEFSTGEDFSAGSSFIVNKKFKNHPLILLTFDADGIKIENP